MHRLPLHVPGRSPPEWMAQLSESQYAVFLSDGSSAAELDLEGFPVTRKELVACYVFESLPEAERFATELAGKHERMVCEVYDRRGKAVPPLRVVTHPKAAGQVVNRRSALWKIRIGWLMLLFAPPLFWLDWRYEGILIVPTLVGFACIVTCIRLLWWGYGELDAIRERENASCSQRELP